MAIAATREQFEKIRFKEVEPPSFTAKPTSAVAPAEITRWSDPPKDLYAAAMRWLPRRMPPRELYLMHQSLMDESEMRENMLFATIPQCIFEILAMKANYTKTSDAYKAFGDLVEETGALSPFAMARFMKNNWRDWLPTRVHLPFLNDMVALAKSIRPVSGPGVDVWSVDKVEASLRKMDCNIYIKRALDAYRLSSQKVLYVENVGEPRTSRWYRIELQAPTCRLCGVEGALPCASCKVAHYCDRLCQRADWKDHKADCKAMHRVLK